MNRTRFYEILKAHEKGEDLSQFVPKNPAEAALIANLQGGTGSSGGSGMPDFPYNNPDLPNLYYGMNLMNKKLYIDFPKLAEYCKTTGIVDVTKVLKSMGSGGVSINLFAVGEINNNNKQFETQSIRFGMDGVSPTLGWSEILGYSYADNNMTIEELFQSYGVVSRDMSSYGLFQEAGCVVALLVDILQCTNLNDDPIDWLWFE